MLIPAPVDSRNTYRRWVAERAAESRRVVEVGVATGVTTLAMAKATRGTIWAVDHWRPMPDEQRALYKAPDVAARRFRSRLGSYLRTGRVRAMRMDSVAAANTLKAEYGLGSFDFVFIDGDHTYAGCLRDIEAYFPLVRSEGMIAGHDFHWPGVRRAVEYWFTACVNYPVTLGPTSLWSVIV